MAEHLSSRVIRAGSFRTYFLEGGERGAPPVLLVHDGAWGGDGWTSWSSVAGQLAGRYHVLVPDMLGFGQTDKAIYFDQSRFAFRWAHLESFLDTLDVREPVHVAGASFGGTLALRAAADPAEGGRIRSVASISGTGGPWRVAEEFKKLTDYDGSDDSMERILRLLVDEFPGLADQVARRQENNRRRGHYQAMGAVRSETLGESSPPPEPADPFPETLQASGVPLLFVEGARDTLLETGWSEQLRDAVGRGDIVTLDTRHSPNIDHPQEVAAVLERFFSSLPTSRP